MTRPLLYLSAEDVRKALPMSVAIEAMRQAFVELSNGQVALRPGSTLMRPKSTASRW